MERSPKWRKHQWGREVMAFICRWQGWWDCGPWGPGLRAQQIAIAGSIITPLQCPSWNPICVSLHWFLAWVGEMGLKKSVIVLCWWACVAVLWSVNKEIVQRKVPFWSNIWHYTSQLIFSIWYIHTYVRTWPAYIHAPIHTYNHILTEQLCPIYTHIEAFVYT